MIGDSKHQTTYRPATSFPLSDPVSPSGIGGPAPPSVAPRATPFFGESQHKAAKVIRHALAERHVFVALIGEPGLGKTLLLDSIMALPGMPVRILKLSKPGQVSAADIVRVERVLEQPALGERHTALFVDDAHAASEELLRFLARVAADRSGLQVILAGRPELWARLTALELAPLVERIALRPALWPLTDGDACGLVKHLLNQPRRSGQVLTEAAEAEVVRLGGGQPERVGQILAGTIMLGDIQARPPIPVDMVQSAAAVLDGQRQPERRRRIGTWAGAFTVLALVAVGGLWLVGIRTPAMRDWTADRAPAAAGLADHVEPEQAPVSASFPVMRPPPLMPANSPTPDRPVPMPHLLGPPAPPVRQNSLTNVSPASAASMPNPTEAQPAPAPVSPEPPPAARTPASLPPGTVAMLLRQGDERLTRRDIAAARRLYERAASAGSAAGARGVAQTYDPALLSRAGMATDPAAAAVWQGVAAALSKAEVQREGR